MIDPELMCELPKWWKHINKDDYYLVLSDDADSLLSCKFLKNKFGLEIGGFYSFEKGLFLNKERTRDGWKVPIYVDLSISRSQFCFDNSTLTLLVALYDKTPELMELIKEYRESKKSKTEME